MNNSPLDVVREYLRMEAGIRRNAVIALSALGDEESLAELVRVALEDKSRSVARSAEEELFRLPEKKLGFAASLLVARLDDPMVGRRANGILGGMAKAGLPVPKARGGLPARLSRVLRFSAHAGSGADWAFRVRALLPGGSGAVVGMLLLGLSLARTLTFLPQSNGFGSAFFGCLGAGLLLAVSASQRTTPLAAQFDRFAAVVFEIISAAVGGLIVGAILLLFCAMSDTVITFGGVSVAGVAALAAAVRAGTLLSVNFSPLGIRSRWWMVIVGATSGFVAMTAVYWATNAYREELCSTFWILLAPAGMGLANFYAANEAPSEGKGRRHYVSGAVCVLIVLMALGLAGLTLAFPYRLAHPKEETQVSTNTFAISSTVPSEVNLNFQPSTCPPGSYCNVAISSDDPDYVSVTKGNYASSTIPFTVGEQTFTVDFRTDWTRLLSPYLHTVFLRLFQPGFQLKTTVHGQLKETRYYPQVPAVNRR